MPLVADISASMKTGVVQTNAFLFGGAVCLGWGAWGNYSDFVVLQLQVRYFPSACCLINGGSYPTSVAREQNSFFPDCGTSEVLSG